MSINAWQAVNTWLSSVNTAVSQSTETDTANAIASLKQKALGQASQTGTAGAITSLKTVSAAQSTETDTVQAIGVLKQTVIGQASQTETVNPFAISKQLAVAQATETDAVQAMTARLSSAVVGVNIWKPVNIWLSQAQTIAVGQATETDAVQSITAVLEALALDSAPATITRGQTELEFVVSSVSAVPTTGNTTITSGTGALTIDSVSGTDPYTITATCPADVALQHDATGYVWTVTIIAQTVDSAAIPLNEPFGYNYLNLANPITTAGSLLEGATGDTPVTGDQIVAESRTSPDNIAVTLVADGTFELASRPRRDQTISRYVIQADGTLGTEADFTTLFTLKAAVGQVTQTGTSNAIAKSKIKAIAAATETDTSQAVNANVEQRVAIGQAVESDEAVTIVAVGPKTVPLLLVEETDSVGSFARAKSKTLGQVTDTQSSQAIGKVKLRLVAQNSETGSAQSITARNNKIRSVGQASETSLARTIFTPGVIVRVVGTVVEVDFAHRIIAETLNFTTTIELTAIDDRDIPLDAIYDMDIAL